jgi:DNA-binding transcriptional regulator LsrR (DeoR family)
MTQQEIASLIGIGRARVIRLLAEARERGVVSIRINSPLLENVELAESLVRRYSLLAADVCLCHASDEHQLAQQLGAAAGPVVHRHIHDGLSIGLGWGITLKELVDQIEPLNCRDVSVISLLGSLTRRSSVTRFEAATELAARLEAECLYLPAPIVCDSADTRRLLVEQPLFREIHQRALQADLAIVSIGGLDSATIREVGLVTDEEFHSVRDNGAIGNFLGYYIDDQARIVDHSINQRIIGIPGHVFKRIPRRFMVSGGSNKVNALRAVLEQGLVTDLVTDQDTARALLA